MNPTRFLNFESFLNPYSSSIADFRPEQKDPEQKDTEGEATIVQTAPDKFEIVGQPITLESVLNGKKEV